MPAWTREQARLNAIKGVEARRRKAEERKRNPEPQQAQNGVALPLNPVNDGYTGRMKARVRKVIDQIAARMAEAVEAEMVDAQKVDRLASGWSKLAEVERQYADRPLPGTKKPDSRQPRAVVEPEVDPVPIVVSTPQ